MNKAGKKIEVLDNSIIEVLKGLNPRKMPDRKTYKAYYDGLTEVLNIVYSVYRGREAGKPVNESEAMTEVTKFLHTLGKVNGKFISVCEKTTDGNGLTAVLFDVLVYHSFKDRIYTKSETLARLEADKATAGKAKAKAHKELIDGKGTAKAYKEAVEAYNGIIAKIEAERSKAGSEGEAVTKQSPSTFIKFATARLKAIINNRYALTEAEAEALRKVRNKEAKAKRKAKAEKPTKAKQEATTTEAEKKTA